MNARNAKPYGGHRRASFQTREYRDALGQLYGKPRGASRLPSDWRERLPDAASYYSHRLDKLGHANAEGWAQSRCPFHEDKTASLSVRLSGRGHWRCFAGCGHGDLVTFHERATGLPFKDAVRDLLGVSHG